MKRVLLRIPDGVYAKVVTLAERGHRSVNAEMGRALKAWGDVGLKDDIISGPGDSTNRAGTDEPRQAECTSCGRTTFVPDGCSGCGEALCPSCLVVGLCVVCQQGEVPF